MVLRNLIPIVLIALLIALGLWEVGGRHDPGLCRVWQNYCGHHHHLVWLPPWWESLLTGLVLIPGMAPIFEGLSIVGDIALVLAGAFPRSGPSPRCFGSP